MAKINEIDITSLTFQEGSAPATPASTKWKIYTKTDGLYYIDDAGSETGPLGAGGGSAAVVLEASGSVGTGTSFTISSITAGYEYLELYVLSKTDEATVRRSDLWVQMGDGSIDTGTNYAYGQQYQGSSSGIVRSGSDSKIVVKLSATAAGATSASDRGFIRMRILDYDNISNFTTVEYQAGMGDTGEQFLIYGNGQYRAANAVDQIKVGSTGTPSFVAGEYWLVGVL